MADLVHAKPVVVIAKQRSGTNLLRRSLATSDWFDDLDEVFHNRPDLGRYWNHRTIMISKDPSLSIPSEENQQRIFDAFLRDYLKHFRNYCLIDIKYNSLHNLDPLWHSPVIRPYLIKMLAMRNIPVVHLVRDSFLDVYVSNQVARKVMRFVTNSEFSTQDIRVRIDIDDMLHSMRQHRREIEQVSFWLKAPAELQVLDLNYDQLLDSAGKFDAQTILAISEFVGLPEPLSIRIPIKKMVRKPIEQIVENYASEVVPALFSNGFENLIVRRPSAA